MDYASNNVLKSSSLYSSESESRSEKVAPGTTNIYSVSWINTKSTEPRKKTNPKKIVTVVNPIFQHCANRTDDPLWKSILMDAAVGKMLRGYLYGGGILTYKNKNKSVQISQTDPDVAVETFIKFVRDTSSVRSKMDNEREKYVEQNYQINNQLSEITSWSDVKSSFNKRLLIINYIGMAKNALSLSQREMDQLQTLIHLELILGNITGSNIQFYNGTISNIVGINWDGQTRTFSYTGHTKAKRPDNTSPTNLGDLKVPFGDNNNTPNLLQVWIKYLKSFSKTPQSNYELMAPALNNSSSLTSQISTMRSRYSTRSD